MSRLYEALRWAESNKPQTDHLTDFVFPSEVSDDALKSHITIDLAKEAKVNIDPASRVVAWSDPRSPGAEKFRAIAARLKNMREEYVLKSVQITGSGRREGKTLISANLAVTLATDNKSRVLLLEGDLQRPTLASLFGLKQIKGLGEWWTDTGASLTKYLVRSPDMPLWFLAAGKEKKRSADILQSTRFAEAFAAIAANFDWVVVDSSPIESKANANPWPRLVDGTLLVVRQGITPMRTLKNNLRYLDNPQLVGVVLNEAEEFDQAAAGIP